MLPLLNSDDHHEKAHDRTNPAAGLARPFRRSLTTEGLDF